MFGRARRPNARYDCLVPLSGGRDSTYVLYLCKKKFGLRPLAVTFNNGFLSDHAIRNMLRATQLLGVDHVLHTYDWQTLKPMYRAAVLNAGEFCSVCSTGIRHVILTYQKKFKIPLVAHGTSSRTDEQSPFEVICSHPVYVRRLLSGAVRDDEINRFMLPDRNDWSAWQMLRAKLSGMDYVVVNIPDFMPWVHEEITRTLETELGWATPDAQADHIDCRFVQMKEHLKNQQMSGFVFRQEKLSQLVRDGQITRETALRRWQAATGPSPELVDSFVTTLDLTEDAVTSAGRKSHMTYVGPADLGRQPGLAYRVLAGGWAIAKRVTGRRQK